MVLVLRIVHLVSKNIPKDVTGFRLRLHACFVKGRNTAYVVSSHARKAKEGDYRGE